MEIIWDCHCKLGCKQFISLMLIIHAAEVVCKNSRSEVVCNHELCSEVVCNHDLMFKRCPVIVVHIQKCSAVMLLV